MARISAAIAVMAVLGVGLGCGLPPARAVAQTSAATRWVQIEAQPTLVKAEERARVWSAEFADVAGFRLASGWYAIALGPYPREEAQRRLALLKATAAIPRDSYLTEDRSLGPRFWPAGAGALTESGVPAGGEAASLTSPPLEPDLAAENTSLTSGGAGEGASADNSVPLIPPVPDLSLPASVLPVEVEPIANEGDASRPATSDEASPEEVTASAQGVPSETAAELAALAPLPEAGPAASPVETLAEARRGEALLDTGARRELQEALAYEGLYAAAIDGAFGSGTRAAMAAWQEGQGQEPTGVLTSAQREALLQGFHAARDSLGLAPVQQAAAGIALRLPLGLLAAPVTRPPFVHYAPRKPGGPQVLLLSQPGGTGELAALLQKAQALQGMPVTAEARLTEEGFTLDGADGQGVVHGEARLKAGQIKGFVLLWPADDDRRQTLALAAMQQSFRALPDAVLPDPSREGLVQPVDLLAGIEIRRPTRARTGFFIDARGHVLTSADAAEGCQRLTLEGTVPAQVLARDAELGLALLQPEAPMVPLAHARLRSAPLQAGAEVASAGFAWEGRLGAAVVSFGRLIAAQGPDGSPDRQQLQLGVTPGEAGAPILDGSGAVVGLLLPDPAPDRLLPEDTALALPAAPIAAFLAAAALPPPAAPEAEAEAALLTAPALAALARDMTVAVACWD